MSKPQTDEVIAQRPYGAAALTIRNRRRELGLKVTDVAQMTERGRRSVYEWEDGNHRPNIGVLAPVLGVPMDELAALLPATEETKPQPLMSVKAQIFDESLAAFLKDIITVEGCDPSDLVLEGLTLVVAARQNDSEFTELLGQTNASAIEDITARESRWASLPNTAT